MASSAFMYLVPAHNFHYMTWAISNAFSPIAGLVSLKAIIMLTKAAASHANT